MPKLANRDELEVILVPLKKRKINPPNFANMPRLYLELLENKEKVRKEFLPLEFIPLYDDVKFDADGDEIYQEPSRRSSPQRGRNDGGDNQKSSWEKRLRSQDSRDSRESQEDYWGEKENKKENKENKENKKENKEKNKKETFESSRDRQKQTETKRVESKYGDDEVLDDDLSSPSMKEEDSLSAFFKKSRSIGSRNKGSRGVNDTKRSTKRESYNMNKDDILRDDIKIPPSLQDLEYTGQFETNGIKNMTRISKREQDEEAKLRELLFKFELIRKSNPTEEIPKFTISSDPEHVSRVYDEILRKLSLTDNITKYKKYLMFGFMGIETLAGNILGFDMKGFTQQQVLDMSSYEKLIIELGEKNYVPQSKWPVELRLLGIIVMNAVLFIATKMAFKSTGTDILNNMNFAANAGVSANANIQQRKNKRMGGPTINLDDLVPPTTEPKAPTTQEKDIKFV